MTTNPPAVPGLTLQGCRARQARLREQMAALKLDAALICDRRHVHYFTGYWCRELFSPLAIIERDGRVTLATPLACDNELAADDVRIYPSNQLGTIVDHQFAAAFDALCTTIGDGWRIGVHDPIPINIANRYHMSDISSTMLTLRRTKDADEVEMLRFTAAAMSAAYRAAKQALVPGIDEVDLWSIMHAAAASYVGETTGEFGNDFQIGAIGSPPRRRQAQPGEVAILDLSVVVRGYAGDLCRSFVTGGQVTDAQCDAHNRIEEVLRSAEQMAKPGARCSELYEMARQLLDGYNGWSFKHHLGHGVGLCNHEAPRLNPHWNDHLQIGDVFTLEPGLYSPALHAGIRIEHMYHLTKHGLERLDDFPTDLA